MKILKIIHDKHFIISNKNKFKIIIMPSYGEKQMPAGVNIPCKIPVIGTRVMDSNNSTITPTLKRIDNIPYKGNAVLNANK